MQLKAFIRFLPFLINTLLTFSIASNLALAGNSVQLRPLGAFATGIFDAGAAEIVAHDPATQRLFVVNGADATIDVLDIKDPSNPTALFAIDVKVTDVDEKANSVAVQGGIVAAAVENIDPQAPGAVVLFDTDGNFLNRITVGDLPTDRPGEMVSALPDMITFTPNGEWLLVANEGEPNDDYSVDPEGSVSIIDLRNGAANITVNNVDFRAFNDAALDPSIRIFGPNATVAQDLEPEFITVADDSLTAWVTLQENNALAIIDIVNANVLQLVGLDFKDHNVSGNGFDASNEDDIINIQNWPTHGMYQPDAIASYQVNGQTFLITANEGDGRDYDGFSEEDRVEDLSLDPTAFPNAATLQLGENLGRLKVTNVNGDTDGDGDFDELFSFGARSFSIWDTAANSVNLVFDSGDNFERITLPRLPDDFNSTNDENNSFDDRSDDKGPEPEGVAIGEVSGSSYAFIGLERVGGIMVFDVSEPNDPTFVQYINTRDFSGDPAAGTAGDLAPEGLIFIREEDSPIDNPLLVVAYEVSGTVTIFAVDEVIADLGKANRFGLLGLQGAKISMSNSQSNVQGDVGLSGKQNFSSGSITGTYFVDPTADNSKSNNVTIVGGTVSKDLSQAVQDALLASAEAAALTPTQIFGNIKNTQTIVGNPGANIIAVESINLKSGATLTLSGGPGDEFIINVSNKFKLDGGSEIKLEGGLLPSRVLFNFPIAAGHIALTGGSKGVGKFLAPERKFALTGGAIIEGAVLAGGDISMTGGARIIPPAQP